MKKFTTLLFVSILSLISVPGFAQSVSYYQTGEEFSGPFPSWKNVKTVFGAKGDGVTNDAPAINAALQALRNSSADSFNVLYFPAGTYLIDDSLYNPGGNYDGMAIIGEDPATTIISWGGPSLRNAGYSACAMFNLNGWYMRISRLTFEGNNNAYRGIFKTGAFSTHNEYSDLVFKDFNSGIGIDFSAPTNGQAENAIIRCSFINCASGIASCNWNSLDQWVWWCLFQDCNIGVNQCIGYCQIYNNVFLRSKDVDISSSPYKNVISGNTSINSKCFYNGYENLQRGNKIYSNVDSFYTDAGSSTVMLDNIIRATKDSLSPVRVGNPNMFIGNTESKINSKWTDWPVQPEYDSWDHGFGSSFNVNKQIEKAIDGNGATSFTTQVMPYGIKWNCPHSTTRTALKYTVSAPVSGGGDSPLNFQLLGSNNWGYKWDTLDVETTQTFTGGGNPITYNIKTPAAYSMYELEALPNQWPWYFADHVGGRSIDNTTAESGTYSEKMALAAFPRYVYQNIKVHADSIYNVSGWMKSNAITTNAYILVLWYNTSSPIAPGAIPTGYIRSDTVGIITGTNGWTLYSKTLTAPNNALSAQLFLEDEYIASSSGTAWFDNFSFVETANLAKNLALNPSFENGGANTYEQWWEVNEFTLLDGSSADITKDPAGLVTAADETWGQFYPLDNAVEDTTAIPYPTTISLPGTPQNLNRKVFEVAKGTGNDALEIQSKIDSAALLPLGSKPVVHIPKGVFHVNTTLTVPANADMQIIGDGLGTGTNATTSLQWSGNNVGPVMLCMGPSRVTIKDLLLNANYSSYVGPEALVIEDADQIGGRIFGQEFNAGGPQWTQPCSIGLWANQIENSDITMMCFYPGFGNTAMVEATGGPILSSGGNTDGQISLLAGATGDSQNLFNVTDGGRMDAEGMWNEGDWARTSGLLNLTNTFGKVTVACMSWNLLNSTYPMLNTDNYSGTLTLLLNHFNNVPWSYMPLTGSGTNFNVLSGYNDYGTGNTKGKTTDSTWIDSTAPAANADFIGNTGNSGFACDVVTSKVHNVLPDSTSILDELSQLRAVRANPPMDMATTLTDVKLFRVAAWGTSGHVGAEFNRVGYTASTNNMSPPLTHFVSLYPTLVQQSYSVSFTIPQSGEATFTVFDVFGRKVSEKQLDEVQGSHTELFYATGLRAGTYYMQFHSGNIVETKKFVVLR
ncbi:MAG TPA: glycosyl hydrolase family 28-related protein [Bacteroidia bacterium]|nr:glycosyl hydrolase family 28-related protein [Bacteroidia bacterium]